MVKIVGSLNEEDMQEIVLLDEKNHLTRDGIILCALDILTDAGLFALLMAILKRQKKTDGKNPRNLV